MTDYTKTTDFTSKDSLPSGDSGKIIRGAEFGTEFDNIQTAVNSKSNINNPSFTGNITVTGTVDGRDIAADGTKLDTIETSADVTDTANVTAAGAVMDSELTDITAVKALNQGVATTDSPTFAAVTSTGNVTVGGTVDGRDVAADGTKLDTVETNADVTDTANVTAAGALMDSEVTNLAQVKAFDSADYATAAQGTTADNALPKTGGAMTGAITTNSTFDGRDVATDGTKLDGIEALADVTDTANVTAAGALMDSELTSIASVKALNQGVATTDTPTFAGVTANGTVEFDGLSGTGAVTVTDILDQDDMSGNSATALATQQSIKAYVDSQVGTVDTLAEVLANGNATGGTDIAFGDNDKAIFGASSDLQIYSDGTNAIIKEDTGGSLYIGGADIHLMNPAFTEYYISAAQNGAVTLRHDNATKLATTATGIDVTGNATFADNGKAIFGAGSDLQIYHDGSHSYISDQGTGQLRILASQFQIMNAAGTESMVFGAQDNTATLYYDNAAKLATTSTGIDVTGIAVTDGLTSAGDAAITGSSSGSTVLTLTSNALADTPLMVFQRSGGAVAGKLAYEDSNTAMSFGTTTAHELKFLTSNTERMQITSAGLVGIGATPIAPLHVKGTTNGNLLVRAGSLAVNTLTGTALSSINDAANATVPLTLEGSEFNFVESNAVVAKIDSSGNVGIGTSSPVRPLSVKASQEQLTLSEGDARGATFDYRSSTGNLNIATNGINARTNPQFTLDLNGKVGIGTDSPETNLHIEDSSSFSIIRLVSSTTENAGIDFGDPDDRDIGRVRYNNSDNSMVFHTNAAEQMRIDSSGNVGIGAASAPSRLTVKSPDNTLATNIAQFDSLNGGAGFKFGYQRIEQIGATTPITFETGGSESMRIDSSGKIGIGTDSPEQPITVGDTSDSQNYIQIKTSATGAAGLLFSDGASTNPAGYLYDHATNSMQFKVNGSEKMRIDSSGNLLVGTTTQSGKVTINNGGSTTGLNVFQTSTATNYVPLNIHNDRVTGGNTAVMIRFQAGDNTDVGSIDSTVTATAYNTSSDQRLKDNIVDAPSASNDIDAIQVRSFDWKADGSHQKYGMVAQELQSVAPEAVSGDADSDEMMGVDYSKLVPMLVKEIQSLRARVAQLETN